MKKSMILVLTLIFVFAFATAAYANADDWNPTGPTYRAPVGGDSPHGSYLTTGDECEICHSPHQAGNSGNGQVASTGDSYKLLRGTDAASACDYCHVGAGAVATGYVVYTVGGTVAKDGINGHEIAAFTDVPDDADGTVAAIGTALDCFDCHTVHGAGKVAGIATVNGATLSSDAILKADANGDSTAATTYNGFCEECHGLNAGETYDVAMITHYMGAANVAGSPRSTSAVADAASSYCYSCHVPTTVAGYVWPHNSYGAALINLDTDGTHDNSAPISASSMDANCLMCHSTVGSAY